MTSRNLFSQSLDIHTALNMHFVYINGQRVYLAFLHVHFMYYLYHASPLKVIILKSNITIPFTQYSYTASLLIGKISIILNYLCTIASVVVVDFGFYVNVGLTMQPYLPLKKMVIMTELHIYTII